MRKDKVNWWMLYALIPSLPILLVLEGRIPGPALEHRLMEFAIVLLTFALAALWVRANESALIEHEMTDAKWSILWDSEETSDCLPLADRNDDLEEARAKSEPPLSFEKDE